MNIFWLDKDPVLCAQYHNDKHIVKMPLELAQLLCTAHHEYGTATPQMYKPTHRNHPCAIWVRESPENYFRTYKLYVALLIEYEHRYGRKHKSGELSAILALAPNTHITDSSTEPPQCMPDDCKHEDYIQAYRQYYRQHKRSIADWTRRADPPWYYEEEL